MVKLIARKRTLSVHYLEFFSSIQGGILQSPAQKIDALRCSCIYRKLQDNLFMRWLVALTHNSHSSNSWRLFFPVGPVKSNQLRWCSGRKTSAPSRRGEGGRIIHEFFWNVLIGSAQGGGKEGGRYQLKGQGLLWVLPIEVTTSLCRAPLPSLVPRGFLASSGTFWGWESADTEAEALLQGVKPAPHVPGNLGVPQPGAAQWTKKL